MVGVDELVDFFLYRARVERNVVLGEELFFLIVVDFVIAYGPNFGLLVFLAGEESSEVVFLGVDGCTSLRSRRS